jgi:hypothetical protein
VVAAVTQPISLTEVGREWVGTKAGEKTGSIEASQDLLQNILRRNIGPKILKAIAKLQLLCVLTVIWFGFWSPVPSTVAS